MFVCMLVCMFFFLSKLVLYSNNYNPSFYDGHTCSNESIIRYVMDKFELTDTADDRWNKDSVENIARKSEAADCASLTGTWCNDQLCMKKNVRWRTLYYYCFFLFFFYFCCERWTFRLRDCCTIARLHMWAKHNFFFIRIGYRPHTITVYHFMTDVLI